MEPGRLNEVVKRLFPLQVIISWQRYRMDRLLAEANGMSLEVQRKREADVSIVPSTG